jgi:hypothetical protein
LRNPGRVIDAKDHEPTGIPNSGPSLNRFSPGGWTTALARDILRVPLS